MRARPNQLMIALPPSRNPNSIYRKYRPIWQRLLTQRNVGGGQEGTQDDPESYVEMPIAHRELYEAVTNNRDSIRCLLGYTGIGKSTIIRHLFEFKNDNPDIRRAPVIQTEEEEVLDSNQIKEERILYIPLFMSGRLIERTPDENVLTAVSNHFASQLAAACRRLFEDSKLEYEPKALADFVESQQRDLLERDISQPINSDKVKRLDGLRKVYRLGFEMMLLKWLLTRSSIQRVVLIVDDVESLSIEDQEAICHVIAQSFEWLRTLKEAKRSWISTAIISLRPLTFNMLQKTDWYKALCFDTPIGLDTPADLKELFEKRFFATLETHKNEQEDLTKRENWQAAWNVFEHVYGRVASAHKNFLVLLCNFSIRRALVEFENLLLNRRYFEPESDMSGPPRIKPSRLRAFP